jgi:hypothetical protein
MSIGAPVRELWLERFHVQMWRFWSTSAWPPTILQVAINVCENFHWGCLLTSQMIVFLDVVFAPQ